MASKQGKNLKKKQRELTGKFRRKQRAKYRKTQTLRERHDAVVASRVLAKHNDLARLWASTRYRPDDGRHPDMYRVYGDLFGLSQEYWLERDGKIHGIFNLGNLARALSLVSIRCVHEDCHMAMLYGPAAGAHCIERFAKDHFPEPKQPTPQRFVQTTAAYEIYQELKW